MANLPLAFGELLAGGVLMVAGATGTSIASTVEGKVTMHPFPNPFGGSGSGGPAQGSGNPMKIGSFPASVNPVPGATGSRLDQGMDGTSSTFLSPWAGKVVYSSSNDPGWAGGGYVAVQSSADPSKVFYAAEGLTPTVQVGQTVAAGQKIADPATNPYNGIVGNFEIGLANPSSPGQPLAQVISNASAMVLTFYHWLRQLGGPQATSTGLAGSA